MLESASKDAVCLGTGVGGMGFSLTDGGSVTGAAGWGGGGGAPSTATFEKVSPLSAFPTREALSNRSPGFGARSLRTISRSDGSTAACAEQGSWKAAPFSPLAQAAR